MKAPTAGHRAGAFFGMGARTTRATWADSTYVVLGFSCFAVGVFIWCKPAIAIAPHSPYHMTGHIQGILMLRYGQLA